ncbi:MAG: hypothetical protein WDM81_14165 [Rhizomicrobium sp.]
MNSIVAELEAWSKSNEEKLNLQGIQLIKNFPEENSPFSWKANIGLSCDGILVSYTVWERVGLQTELIVVSAATGNTVAYLIERQRTAQSSMLISIKLSKCFWMAATNGCRRTPHRQYCDTGESGYARTMFITVTGVSPHLPLGIPANQNSCSRPFAPDDTDSNA